MSTAPFHTAPRRNWSLYIFRSHAYTQDLKCCADQTRRGSVWNGGVDVQKHYKRNFSFAKLGAGAEFPDLLPNNIHIEMWDGSTFRGVMEEIGRLKIPVWMSPKHTPQPRQGYQVFFVTISGRRFISQSAGLEPEEPRKLLANHKSFHHFPIFADLRFGSSTYIAAKGFQIFYANRGLVHMNPHSRIYVVTPEGTVVTAIAKNRYKSSKRAKYPEKDA